jgi:ParB family chromosome partitioning protein
MVDEGRIAFRPAVELSYLPEEKQEYLLDMMECEDSTPSLAQAIKMKKFEQEEKLSEDVIYSIMTEEKPNQVEQFKIPKKKLAKYFPSGTPKEKMEDTIIKALELYRKRQRERNNAR